MRRVQYLEARQVRQMKFSRGVTRYNILILLVAVLLVPPALFGITKVAVDFDALNFLPKRLGSVIGISILDNDFSVASNALLIVENKSTRQVLSLKESIAAVEGVGGVIGIDDILDPTIPRELLPDMVRVSFYSEKGSLFIIRFVDASSAPRTLRAVGLIRGLLDADCYLSGATATNIDSRKVSESEAPVYLLLAVGLVTIILGFAMESWLIPVIFLAEIGLAIVYNMGTNFVLGKISFLTQALAAVLQLGVTMDFSIFLLHRYDEERSRFADRREAMASAIEKTFVNIAGSALTDVAGFLALCVMDLALGFDMGIVMAKGVVIGLVVTVTVLPAMILALDTPIHRLSHRPLMFGFQGLAQAVTKRPLPLVAIFILLFIPAIYGRNHVKLDYDLSGGGPADLPSSVAARKLKTDFNMMTTHFIIIRDNLPPPSTRAMIARFEEVEGVTGVVAIEKYIGALIPEEFLPEAIRSIFRHGGRELMIVNSNYGISIPEENAQLDKIISIMKEYDAEGMVTGEGALSKDLVAVAARDFIRVDLVSIIGIAIIVALVFLSLSMPVVLVGAIELAIMINMAIPYFLGQQVSFISTIVIGCIQLGVTIDYSILLVSRYKEGLRSGSGAKEAMRKAIVLSAPSILTSGLILSSATAGVAFVSSLRILKSICTLISRGAVISMGVVLLLLPALLIVTEPVIRVTTLNWRESNRRRRLRKE